MAQPRRIVMGWLLSLAGFALQADSALAAATQAAVHLADGQTTCGTISALSADGLSLSVDGLPQLISLDDLIVIEFADHTARPTARSWLLLSNGDRAPLSPIDLVDDALLCRWDPANPRDNWRVPLDLVTALLRQPLNVGEDVSLLPELSRREFNADTLILGDGARLAGALEGVTAESFRVETAVGIVPVDASRVDAIAMNAALVRQPEPAGRWALLSLCDGSWLTVQDLAIGADGALTGRTGFGAELKVAPAEVVRVACYGPQVVDLTQRAPQSVQSTPFVTRRHALLVNRNVRGGWLRLGGRSYARGIGMSSGMSATFDLDPDDRRFQATIGIDECVGNAGSVSFVIALDGRRLFTSPIVRGGDPPLVVGPLDIAGGTSLTLSVEFADYGNMQDVANWCDPLILR